MAVSLSVSRVRTVVQMLPLQRSLGSLDIYFSSRWLAKAYIICSEGKVVLSVVSLTLICLSLKYFNFAGKEHKFLILYPD